MLNKLATIETIKKIETHPNADRLDLVTVRKFTAVVGRDSFKEGDKVLFIHPDTVLPESPWAEFYKKFNPKRVKAQKLRDVWSFGIVVALADVGLLEAIEVGTEVSDHLGISKYEPPIPQEANAIGELPVNLPKTDELMYQNLENLESLFGKEVDVTLKIDGSSWTAYCQKDDDGEWKFGICGRQLEFDTKATNHYTIHNEIYSIEEKLMAFCKNNDVSLAIRGEVYGDGLQSCKNNMWSKKPLGLALYSCFNLDTMYYERKGDEFYIFDIAEDLGIPTVPVIDQDIMLSQELIDLYREDLKTVNGEYFEGVVINTDEESFKVINMDYDSRK